MVHVKHKSRVSQNFETYSQNMFEYEKIIIQKSFLHYLQLSLIKLQSGANEAFLVIVILEKITKLCDT